jgi:hypothetical protein
MGGEEKEAKRRWERKGEEKGGRGTYSQEIKLDLMIHVNYHQLLYHDKEEGKRWNGYIRLMT